MGLGLSGYVPLVAYVCAIFVIALALFGRVETGAQFAVFMVPMTSVYYKMYDFPLGRNVNDFLLISLFVATIIHRTEEVSLAGRNRLKQLLVVISLYSYLSIWVGFFHYADSVPLSFDNIRLATWKEYISMFLLFWLVFCNVRTDRQISILMVVMMLSISIVAWQYLSEFRWVKQYHYSDRMKNVTSTFGYLGANHLGSFFSQYGVALLGVYTCAKQRLHYKNLIFLAVSFLSLYAMLFTYSRGAYLGAIAGIVVMLYLVDKKLLLIPAVFLATWQFVLPNSVVERITMTRSSEGELDDSSKTRITLWQESLEMSQREPVFGLGFDTFAHGETHYRGYRETHNIYIKTFIEQGIVGLILLFVLIFRALTRAIQLTRVANSPFQKGIGVGCVGMVVSCIISNCFGDRWTFYMLAGFFWVFLAVLERMHAITEGESAPGNPLEAGLSSLPRRGL